MTMFDVENFLLKVGASKYRDETIKKQFPNFSSISHFGIGILTCFMVANDIDIVTNSEEQNDVNCISLRKVNGSYLLRRIKKSETDQKIRNHGTMVKLYVRNDVDMSTLEADLRKWIVLPEIPVYLSVTGNKEVRIGYSSLKEVVEKYLNDTGRNVDGEKFDVYEETQGNVTIAYAVRHLKYLSDWCLLEVDSRRTQKKIQLPIGTCVEGIRVEFTTPGYDSSTILAIANIKDSKYQTNVARSALELDANSEILSEIYDIYRQYVQEQMDKLEQLDYSKSWAISEGRYLMRPLVSEDYGNYRADPKDESVLTQTLAKIKNIALENDGKRHIVSAEDIYDLPEVNIFECKMTEAAEYLLKEIKSEATLKDLIGVVCSEDNFLGKANNVFCNYDMSNILHQYALSNKEISSVVVSHKQRRIKITYSNTIDQWYIFDLRNRGMIRKLYVPKKDFLIEGLIDEIGVKTYGSIIVKSSTTLYDYVMKIIKVFLDGDTEENRFMLEIFLESIFDSNSLERVYTQDVSKESAAKQFFDDRNIRLSAELMDKIWNKVDINEFTKVVLTQNYTLYSIDNWTRSEDEF